MGGGKKTETVVQQSGPPAFAQPFIEKAMREAENASGQLAALGPIQGPFTAQANPFENMIVPMLAAQAAKNAGVGQLSQQATNAFANKLLSGGFEPITLADYNPAPYIENAVTAALQPTLERFTEAIIPQARASATEAGAFGGNAAEFFVPQNITREFAREASRTAQEAALRELDSFRQDRGRSNVLAAEATRGLPGMELAAAQAGNYPIQLLQQAGLTQRQIDELGVQENLARQQVERQAIVDPLEILISGAQLPFGNVSTTKAPAGSSGGVGGAIKGGIGGLAMAGGLSQIPALSFMGGPWGLAAGAALGALGGLFG